MKNKILILFLITMSSLSILTNSCKKDDNSKPSLMAYGNMYVDYPSFFNQADRRGGFVMFDNLHPTVLNSVYRMTITFGSRDTIVATYPVGDVDPGLEVIRHYLATRLLIDPRISWDLCNFREYSRAPTTYPDNSILIVVQRNPSADQIGSFTATIEPPAPPNMQ